MVNSRVAADDLATEMTVVRNEFEASENDPMGVTLFRAGRPAIGARSDIEGVTIERLRAFCRKYYNPTTPSSSWRATSGSSTRSTSSAHISAPRPRPDGSREDMTLWPTYTREPAQEGERRVEIGASRRERAHFEGAAKIAGTFHMGHR
jgi:zinc protease